MELGHAIWPELLRHADPNDITAVWISHLHPDHCVDLFATYQWAGTTSTARRLTVYGPAGWAERIGAALPTDDGPAKLRRLFDVREHTDSPQQIGDVELAAVAVQHSVPTHGLRLTHRGTVLAFSGDSGPCNALTALAADADVFLCEAGASDSQLYHCTPKDAARLSGGASRLVLSHLAPGMTAADVARRAGGATVAEPNMVIDCTAG